MEATVSQSTSSRSARIAYRVVTLLLVLVLVGSAVAVVSELFAFARGGDALIGGRKIGVHAELARDRIRSLPPAVHLADDPHVALELNHPSTKQRLLADLQYIGPFFLLVGVLWILREFARSVTEDDPFGAGNVRRLRTLGFLLVIGAPVVEVVNHALRTSLSNTLESSAYGGVGFPGFSVPFFALLGGLGAFVLAEVFAYGVRLREDVEGTI
jgi:Protein of unknown function (DUF2975)